jgi:HSP20 family protein
LPGVKPEDLEIDEHEGILTIRAKSDRESEGERFGWHIQERHFGMHQRTLRIPVDV